MSAPQGSAPQGSAPQGSAPQRSAPQASTPPLTPAAGWFEELRRDNDSVWGAIHSHPFVTGIGSGTLDVDRFRFFLSQDYPYLKEFCRVLALAVSRGGR
ncbi:MAG: hypothetical protein QUU85_06180, partial [Candidatus Eisenbacteria bacterium]|nr:hypothetical protein [Candidatus Eisenbacteria bacterium]